MKNIFIYTSQLKGETMPDNKSYQPLILSSDAEIEEERQDDIHTKLLELAEDEYYNTYSSEEDFEGGIDKFISKYLAKNKDKFLKDFVRMSQPGTYNCHEALDRVMTTEKAILRLIECDSIVANPEWYKLVHQAHHAIYNLYQAIGFEHLEAIPDNIIELIEAKKAVKNERSKK